MIETANSLITGMFPRKIHAVTAKGSELKILLFVIAYNLGFATWGQLGLLLK